MPDRCFCETKARPHVALDVIDPALRPSLGLGLVRTVQPHLEAHPQGHIGTHSASTGSIPPGHPRPGPGSPPWRGRRDGGGSRRRDARRLRRGIGSERRCLRGAPVPRSRPGTTSGSSRRPKCGSSHRLRPNRSDCPQSALRLLPWNHLEGHRSLGLAGMPARLNVVLQNRVAPVVSQCPHFSQQHRAGLQTIPGVVVTNSVYGSSFDLCLLRSFDLRYPR